MEFGLSHEQAMLRQAAQKFLAAECPSNVVRAAERDSAGFDRKLWSEAARLGWLGCGIAESFGGYGDFYDATIVAEEIGRAQCPIPYVSTVMFAANALQSAKSEALKADVLPAIVNGGVIVADAISDRNPSFCSLSIGHGGGMRRLNGRCDLVRDVRHADYVLCTARFDNDVVVLLAPTNATGISTQMESNISGESLGSIIFSNVRIADEFVVGDISGVEDAVLRGWVGRSAWLLGASEAMLDLTLAYVKTREQFGAPIGSLQVIQHQCADMKIATTMARGLVEWAASSIAKGRNDRQAALMARIKMLEVYDAVVAGSHKLHGAIGLTREYDLSLYSRRALSSALGAISCTDDLSALVESLGI